MTHPVPPLADLQAAAKHFTLRVKLKADGVMLIVLGVSIGLIGLLSQHGLWRQIGFLASAGWFVCRGITLWTEVVWRAPRTSRSALGLSSLAGLAALGLELRFAAGQGGIPGAAIWIGLGPFAIGLFWLVIRPEILSAGPAPPPAAAAWLAVVAGGLARPPRIRSFNSVDLTLEHRSLRSPTRAQVIGPALVLWNRGINQLSVAERSQISVHRLGEPRPYLLIALGKPPLKAALSPAAAATVQRWLRDDRNDRDLWLPPLAAQVIGHGPPS